MSTYFHNPTSFSISLFCFHFSGDEDANLLFLFVQTIILVVLFVVVRFCCVFWRKEKLKHNGLSGFLEKRVSNRIGKDSLSVPQLIELRPKFRSKFQSSMKLESLILGLTALVASNRQRV